jgi:hypothetical protein
MFIKKLKDFYRLLKTKKVDNILIYIGIAGVIIGMITNPMINQTFAWFVLLGFSIKLYDFTEEIERNLVPYDFNKLLPPPKKNK